MSDIVRPWIDNVIIVIEPGNHEESVSPRVANYIGQLQRENARLRAVVARELPESSERQLQEK
jgi:hypothetical protein